MVDVTRAVYGHDCRRSHFRVRDSAPSGAWPRCTANAEPNVFPTVSSTAIQKCGEGSASHEESSLDAVAPSEETLWPQANRAMLTPLLSVRPGSQNAGRPMLLPVRPDPVRQCRSTPIVDRQRIIRLGALGGDRTKSDWAVTRDRQSCPRATLAAYKDAVGSKLEQVTSHRLPPDQKLPAGNYDLVPGVSTIVAA